MQILCFGVLLQFPGRRQNCLADPLPTFRKGRNKRARYLPLSLEDEERNGPLCLLPAFPMALTAMLFEITPTRYVVERVPCLR